MLVIRTVVVGWLDEFVMGSVSFSSSAVLSVCVRRRR